MSLGGATGCVCRRSIDARRHRAPTAAVARKGSSVRTSVRPACSVAVRPFAPIAFASPVSGAAWLEDI